MSFKELFLVAIFIEVLFISFSAEGHYLEDFIKNSGAEKNTSILDLRTQHQLLKDVVEYGSEYFSAIRIDLEVYTKKYHFDHIFVGTIFNQAELQSGNQSGNNILQNVKIIVGISTSHGGANLLDKAEELIKNDLLNRYNIDISIRVPITICERTVNQPTKADYTNLLTNLEQLDDLLRKHGSSTKLAIEPAYGYSGEEGCYLSKHAWGPTFLAKFHFATVSIRISRVFYTFAEFTSYVDGESRELVRKIGLTSSKPDVIIEIELSLSEDEVIEPRTIRIYEQTLGKFAYKYGTLRGLHVQFSLLAHFHEEDSAEGMWSDEDNFISKAVVLSNPWIIYEDVPYNVLSTRLAVISRNFPVIVLDDRTATLGIHPDHEATSNSNWEKLFQKVGQFNNESIRKNQQTNVSPRISIIVRLAFDPDKGNQTLKRINLLSDIQKKYSGVIQGVIIGFSATLCAISHMRFEVEKITESFEGARAISKALNSSNLPLVACGCYEDLEDLTQELVQLFQQFQTDHTPNQKTSFYRSYTFYFDSLKEAREYLKSIVDLKNKHNFTNVWAEFMWTTEYDRPEQDCTTFKEFYEMVFNWAVIHGMSVIVNDAFNSGTGWFKRVGDEFEQGEEETTDFLAKTEDVCLDIKAETIEDRINWNHSLVAVSVNTNSSNLSIDELRAHLYVITMRFYTLEIVLTPEDLSGATRMLQSIHKVRTEKGHNFKLKIYLGISPAFSDDFSLLSVKQLIRKIPADLTTNVAGVHLYQVMPSNCTTFITPPHPSSNLDRPGANHKVGIVLKLTMYVNFNACPYKNLAQLDYVVVDLYIDDFMPPSLVIATQFYDMIESNNLYEFHNMFNRIRNLRFYLQKIKSKLEVHLRFKWRKVDPPENNASDKLVVRNMLLFWKFVNEFCSTFDFPFIIAPAMESYEEDGPFYNVDGAGWWRVLNSSNLSNFSVYVEKESEYLKLETPIPKIAETPPLPQEKDSDNIVYFYLFGAVVVGTSFVTIITILSVRLHRKTVILSKEEIRQFVKGLEENERDWQELGCARLTWLAYDSSLEIGKEEFQAGRSTIVGTGNFGIIYKADIPRFGEQVAVKVPNPSNGAESFRSLLREIKIMSCVRGHANVLRILGAYTKQIRRGVLYLVTEYCSNGSLLTYLRSLSSSRESDSAAQLSIYELCKFAKEILSGMEYIAETHIIHGDLATRNVLLTNTNQCKICDFGLSRKLDIYVKSGGEPLPWRWMAVESLKKMEFSEKSDVWSFGVTFWEILTLGDVPYVETSWTVEFVQRLENGLRLGRPKFASEKLYEIQQSCFQLEASQRPTFSQLVPLFQNLRGDEDDYVRL